MAKLDDFGSYETAWCPGCGNFGILEAVKKALVASDLEPSQLLFVSGIGQAAKTPHYLNVNVFNGLHGRSLPAATGAKLANPKLTVIAESGDGCMYSEGGNHFISAIRRNINITLIVHDNQVYGLTKGQASPTSIEGMVTKAQPQGVVSTAFNPVEIAVAMRTPFVARGFAGMVDHLAGLISQAIAHRGFSMVDVLQPCVSFNRVNTFAWYSQRCYQLGADYDPANWDTAIKKATEFGDKIPLGVIFKREAPTFEDHLEVLKQGPLVGRETDLAALQKIMEDFL